MLPRSDEEPTVPGLTGWPGWSGGWLPLGLRLCDRGGVYGRVVTSTTELRGFVRETVGDVYRYALALTVSPPRAEQLTTSATLRLARHVDAVGAAPVSTARLTLVVRREVLDSLPRRRRRGSRRIARRSRRGSV